ncbi:SMI1/KNR4 family protein [Tundrisphaera sp. TA3]|uniref:SMI1/KNR4 family protein n=1 Tax=Tundrisphaera sp. TA3 TaxID=3435775 RepID=UPI003EB6E159
MPSPEPSWEILVASTLRKPVDPAEIAAVAGRLGVRFPEGYEAFLTRYGKGSLSNWVRIKEPAEVERFTLWLRDFLREQIAGGRWFWDEDGVLPPSRAVEAVAFGDTVGGDTLIFHPDDPDVIYALPRHDDVVYRIGRGLAEALDWLFHSGILTRPILCLLFEPDVDRDTQSWQIDLPYEEVCRGLLALGLHDEVVNDGPKEEFFQVLVREFGGTVTVTGDDMDDEVFTVVSKTVDGVEVDPDEVEPIDVTIERDPGPTTPNLRRLIAWLDQLEGED